MRGKAPLRTAHSISRRITPAYAGKSSRPLRPPECRKDHPRVCGEKQKKSPTGLVTRGSPPHVRGKGADEQGVGGVAGITPAYAGKRVRCSQQALPCTDHPRMCGEKRQDRLDYYVPQGSPPHVRGKELRVETCFADNGITPACAGKSNLFVFRRIEPKDHPRVCGEKLYTPCVIAPNVGSPPRMRGKVIHALCYCAQCGITPAYAGKRRFWSRKDRLD